LFSYCIGYNTVRVVLWLTVPASLLPSAVAK
jgi:hypothetical protein